ncbi:hypothetical protein Poly21_09190 [Allorhodopirellula heiligendammensis]|uniref:Uncharacterized protein n=1 Tax=Allorhodopirellula heiligendammensis TaxID=2714739 RepID=A0A5C6C2P6_9BACT|nr:hypothetical protein Poly21_09190 [Allorhodopirellula heiligendammensis]
MCGSDGGRLAYTAKSITARKPHPARKPQYGSEDSPHDRLRKPDVWMNTVNHDGKSVWSHTCQHWPLLPHRTALSGEKAGCPDLVRRRKGADFSGDATWTDLSYLNAASDFPCPRK